MLRVLLHTSNVIRLVVVQPWLDDFDSEFYVGQSCSMLY